MESHGNMKVADPRRNQTEKKKRIKNINKKEAKKKKEIGIPGLGWRKRSWTWRFL